MGSATAAAKQQPIGDAVVKRKTTGKGDKMSKSSKLEAKPEGSPSQGSTGGGQGKREERRIDGFGQMRRGHGTAQTEGK